MSLLDTIYLAIDVADFFTGELSDTAFCLAFGQQQQQLLLLLLLLLVLLLLLLLLLLL